MTTTIDRVGKRDVILANGDRFNADRRRRSSDDPWSPSTHLLPADDPEVLRARKANVLSRATGAFRRALDVDLRTLTTDEAITDAVAAVAAAGADLIAARAAALSDQETTR